MSEFFWNAAISIFVFASWYAAGFGPSLILFPRNNRQYIFFLSPLIGLSLLTLIGVFQITVLLTPLTLRANISVLVLITLLLLCVRRYYFQAIWKSFHRRLIWLYLIPFALLMTFAWLFHQEGFYLLTGGSDQLQYSQNARQIIEAMHTGSIYDVPVPRQDHFIYEMYTRTLPYIKSYRKGAEVILATTAYITNLTYEEAFPVTILCALLTLGLVIAFISRLLQLSLSAAIALQAAFLGSFYLLQAHIQGSLALIMSLAPGLASLALMSRMVSAHSRGWLFSTSIVVAAYLSIYSEPALVALILPSILLVILQFSHASSHGFIALKRIVMMYLIVAACSPFAVYSIVINAIGNILPTFHQLIAIGATQAATIKTASSESAMQIWALSPPVMGALSYYDTSAFNNRIAQFVAGAPWVGLAGYLILGSCALLGYLKKRNRLVYLFASILVLWMAASLILAKQQDYLRLMRSMQYAIPFILFGLVMLASQHHYSQSARQIRVSMVTAWIGKILLGCFILMNAFTMQRTINFITSHTVDDDPILLRLNERWDTWHLLKNELHYSAISNTPVLISGFKETIRPTAIALVIRSQPHVLGTSTLQLWPIYTAFMNASWPFSYTDFHVFNTRFSKEEFLSVQRRERLPWTEIESRLIDASLQAVVPSGGDYPIEWQNSRDVFSPRVKQFLNIGDVVYRHQYAVNLKNEMMSSLKRDGLGPFRLLWKSGPIMINDQSNAKQSLVLTYEGKNADITLKIGNQEYNGQLDNDNRIKISADVAPEDIKNVHLLFEHENTTVFH